jgi:hypothetical protein
MVQEMTMHIGMQLRAPDGFRSLSKSNRYYFAGRGDDGGALLVWFEKTGKQRRVRVIRLGADEFERALLENPPGLVPEDRQYTLPEWLNDFEGISLEEVEELRYKECKETYRQQVERTYSYIAHAVEHKDEIISASDPLKELSKYARFGKEAIHPHRIQVWFFSYILHGTIWALKRSSRQTGRWSRTGDKHADKKFGRPSLVNGSMYGWSSAKLEKAIEASFLKHCGLGVSMAEIHRRALEDDFGCKVERLEPGKYRLYHPQNKPFPSYGQFRYVVVRKYGVAYVQTKVWGAPRVRSHAKQNEGNFTRPYANLLESLVVDAYHVAERARAFRSAEAMPSLIAARGVCETTGAIVGVGFSLGAETGEAYRSMLFCMAVPKKYFARLVGIPPEDLDWIMEGLPASFTSDRGPCGSKDLVTDLEAAFPIKTIIPSYSGQSNAVAEASHPRTVNLEGAPSFKQSDLNVVEMIKREVYRACRDNHTKDISDRLTADAIIEFRQRSWLATPHYLWKYLQERLRTSGHSMSIEQAVRAFCTPLGFAVDCDGVVYKSNRYTSEEFKRTGIQTQVANLPNFRLTGFVLSMVTRYIWVEVRGQLIEVEASPRVRMDDEDLYVPLSQLEHVADERRILKAATREGADAADVDARLKFERATGRSWDAGHRRVGSPKRPTGTTGQEAKVLDGTLRKRRGR